LRVSGRNLSVILMLIATMGVSLWLMFNLVIYGGNVGSYGLIGLFAIALLGHVTVVAKDTFIPVFLSLTGFYHPALLGLSAGVGGAIGETVTYYWGLSIRETLRGGIPNSKNDRVSEWIKKYGLLAVLLVAASPLPDTPIILLAGSAKLPLGKLLAIEVVGKVLWYSVGAYFGERVFAFMSASLGQITTSLLIFAFSLILCVLLYSDRLRRKVLSLPWILTEKR